MAIEKHQFTPLIDQACWRTIGVWGNITPRCDRLNEITHCRNCEVFAEAAYRVFQQTNTEGELLEKSKDIYERANQEHIAGEFAALPFRIGTQWYFVPPANVLNVSENLKIHSLPKRSSEVLLGMVAINGEVHTCISLGRLIGMPEPTLANVKVKGAFERVLSIKLQRKRISFLVDEVQTIVRYDQPNIANAPSNIPQQALDYVNGLVTVESEYLGPMCSLDLVNIENSYRALIA